MTWILISVAAPLLYAIANHTDKYLLERYFKGGEVGSFIIFSSVFSIIIIPFIVFFNPDVLSFGFFNSLILLMNGCLIIFSLILYLYALSEDEASVVIPFYQTIPIFSYILAFFILHEKLSLMQIIASLLIIFGAFILSFRLDNGVYKFRKKVVLFMLAASFFYALNGVIFKMIAIDAGFWGSTFWEQSGKIILGILIFIFIRSYREQFLRVFKMNKFSVLSLNILNETVVLSADLLLAFASLLAPIALVMTVSSFQPLFVLIIGIVMALLAPKYFKESLSKKYLIQKILAITLIIIGSIIICMYEV